MEGWIVISILILFLTGIIKSDDQDALLNIYTNSSKFLLINSKNVYCHNCKNIQIAQLNNLNNVSLRIDTFRPSYYIFIQDRSNSKEFCVDYFRLPYEFGENGTYFLEIISNKNETDFTCKITVIVEPESIYQPIYISIGVFIGAAIAYIILKKLYKNYNYVFSNKNANKSIIDSDFGSFLENNSSTNSVEPQSLNSNSTANTKSKSSRMKSVDAFRGLCLCIMIFANYGAGGYSFLDHAVWNGLHLADTVFPCFIFIMGISIPLSFKSIASKSLNSNGLQTIKLKSLLYKILKRSCLLFFFGLVTSNSTEYFLTHLRIMGVLQRFAISYFVCALLELIYFRLNNYTYIDVNQNFEETSWNLSKIKIIKDKFKEIFLYPIQWIVVSMFTLVWLLVTFLLPLKGCPTGYIGPGGLHENGLHENCTGGAAGLIDRIILGDNHVYQSPTCKETYLTQVPYDPEGLLGCLTSCVLTYLGISTGHIIIHYKETGQRLWKFIFYALFYGVIAIILCKFSIDDGWIPINKNLWSLSFILALAGIAFTVLTLMYIIIDIYDIYSGTPFLYLGRNSITIYICHIIFQNNFPNFKVPNKHSYLLGNDLYCISIWCIIAALMDYNKVYINL